MIMLDNTVVNVALPTMQKDLHVTVAPLEWVVVAYALTFALPPDHGRQARRPLRAAAHLRRRARHLHARLARVRPVLDDRRPHRRARRPGSRLRAHEPGDALDHQRDVRAEGARPGDRDLGGSLRARSRDRPARRWSDHADLGWNWIFFINVPVGVIAIVVSQLVIRESRDTSHEQSIDIPGLLTSIGFLFSLSSGSSRGTRMAGRQPRFSASSPPPSSSSPRSSRLSCGSGCRCSTCRSSGSVRSPARTSSR